MHSGRLLVLAEYLENLNDDMFNMGWWFHEDHPTECGTASCAMGHACRMPVFQELGLTAELDQRTDTYQPCYRGRRGFGAAEMLFDIEHHHATYLFSSGSYDRQIIDTITPKIVAQRIRRCINEGFPSYLQPTNDE